MSKVEDDRYPSYFDLVFIQKCIYQNALSPINMHTYHISIKRYHQQKAVLGYKVQASSTVTPTSAKKLYLLTAVQKSATWGPTASTESSAATTHLPFKPHRSLCLIDSLRIQTLRAGKSRLSRQKTMLHWKSGMLVGTWSGKGATWGERKRTGNRWNYKKKTSRLASPVTDFLRWGTLLKHNQVFRHLSLWGKFTTKL